MRRSPPIRSPGSYYVEHLTDDELETRRARAARARRGARRRGARDRGGILPGGDRALAYEHQLRVERGETVIVGVNKFTEGESEVPVVPTPDYSALEAEQRGLAGRGRGAGAPGGGGGGLRWGRTAGGERDARWISKPRVMARIVDACARARQRR